MNTALHLRAMLNDVSTIVSGVLATYHVWLDLPELLQQAGMA